AQAESANIRHSKSKEAYRRCIRLPHRSPQPLRQGPGVPRMDSPNSENKNDPQAHFLPRDIPNELSPDPDRKPIAQSTASRNVKNSTQLTLRGPIGQPGAVRKKQFQVPQDSRLRVTLSAR